MPWKDSYIFQATGSLTDNINERSAKHRKRLPWRLFTADTLLRITWAILATHVLYDRIRRKSQSVYEPKLLTPLVGQLMCLVWLIRVTIVPVRYILSPPTVPEWDELVEEDDQGVTRPKAENIPVLEASNSPTDFIFEILAIALAAFM